MKNQGPGRILKIMGAFMHSKILLVATKLGLFDVIGDDCLKLEEISKKLKVREDYCRIFLNALVAIGLLKKSKKLYSNSSDVKDFLLRKSKSYMGDLLLFQEDEWISWNYLYQTMIEGNPKGINTELAMTDDELKNYINAMHQSGRFVSRMILSMIDLKECKTFLDLGCGSGVFGLSFLQKYPKLNITFLDNSKVLDITKQYAKDYDVNYIEANYDTYDFKDTYDCVFCSHNVHLKSPEENQDLFRRIYSILNKKGLFVIHEYMLKNSGTSPIFPAVFSVNMMLQTGAGRNYTFSEIERMLKDAGFESIENKSLGNKFQSSIVTAKKL